MFAVQGAILFVALIAMFAVEAWAFIDALSNRADAFVAAEKMTKKAWLVILGLALAALVITSGGPVNILNMIGIVAALVYIVDVRPAIRSMTRR